MSSTTPRPAPRCPPVTETASIVSVRSSCADLGEIAFRQAPQIRRARRSCRARGVLEGCRHGRLFQNKTAIAGVTKAAKRFKTKKHEISCLALFSSRPVSIVNSEQKRNPQRQPLPRKPRRAISSAAATFPSQLLNNPARISRYPLVFLSTAAEDPILSRRCLGLTLNSFARVPGPP